MNSSTPIQIPGELVNVFPDALKSQVEVILTEARREFQGKNPNTQPVRDIRRAEEYLLERITPLFSGAVEAGDVDADTARRCVREFFDSLRECNSDTLLAIRLMRPVRASDMPEGNPGALLAGVLRQDEQELLASEKWLKFTQEIAKADDTRRRAQAPATARAFDERTNPDAPAVAVAARDDEQRTRAEIRRAVVTPILDKLGWTRSKWAAKAGVDPSVVYDYLDGKSSPRPDSRKCLAEAIDLPASDLPR